MLSIDNNTRYVINALKGLGMNQAINTPTRITSIGCTIIDYILISERSLLLDIDVLSVPRISDRELVCCILELPHISRTKNIKTRRD